MRLKYFSIDGVTSGTGSQGVETDKFFLSCALITFHQFMNKKY